MEGEIEVTFENGIATFTRLRVDRPSSDLRLAFATNPGSLKVNSSVMFNVHEPTDDANKKVIVLILLGDTSILDSGDNSMMINDIRKSLSHTLDIDYSRIINIDYVIMVGTTIITHYVLWFVIFHRVNHIYNSPLTCLIMPLLILLMFLHYQMPLKTYKT